MRVKALALVTVALWTPVFSSSGAAQSEPSQEWLAPRIPSEVLDAARLAFDGAQRAEDREPGRPFLRDVVGDVGRLLGSPESAVSLGIGLAASLSVRPLDEPIQGSSFNSRSSGHESAGVVPAFKAGNVLGSSLVQIGGAFVVYGAGTVVEAPRVAEVGRDLLRAQLLAGGITQFLKHAVRRRRPGGDESSRTSFPSGHTSGTFASATVLSRHYGWKVGIPAFGLASLVGASRMADDSHYLSDVVFGAALGLTAGRSVTFTRGATRFVVAPMAVPRGGGIRISVE